MNLSREEIIFINDYKNMLDMTISPTPHKLNNRTIHLTYPTISATLPVQEVGKDESV